MTPIKMKDWINANPQEAQEILDRVGYPSKLIEEIGGTPNKRNTAMVVDLCEQLNLRYSNSKKLTADGQKYCKRCRKWKPVQHYSAKNSVSSGLNAACTSCQNADQRSRWSNMDEEAKAAYKKRNAENKKRLTDVNRALVIEWLMTNPCGTCGEDDILVLEFAHKDRSEKLYNVTELLGFSKKRLLAEMDKCKSLCANCHRRETMRECNSYKLHPEKYLELLD